MMKRNNKTLSSRNTSALLFPPYFSGTICYKHNFKTQRRNKSSYLVGISKTNIGTDIASWRWCQFWNANARPARIRPPKWWELIDSVVTKAWVLGLVHSNTERKRKTLGLLFLITPKTSLKGPGLSPFLLICWGLSIISGWVKQGCILRSGGGVRGEMGSGKGTR